MQLSQPPSSPSKKVAFKNALINFWNRNKTSKLFWGIIIIAVIVIIFLVRKGDTTTSGTVATATESNIVQSVVLSGRTQSASAVDLGFAAQGRVASVLVTEGNTVKAGQLLASIDHSDLDASLKNAEAALTIAKAGVSNSATNLQAVTIQQNTLVQNAYQNLLSSGLEAVSKNSNTAVTVQPPVISGTYVGDEGEYDISVYASSSNSGASFTVSGVESGFLGQVSANTPVPLGTKGLYISFPSNGASYVGTNWVISIPNTRSASYVANESAYTAAQAARDTAIANAQASLVSSSGSSNSIAQAQIDQAQASVDSIIAQINNRKIIAPFDGTVATVNLKPGQTTTTIGTNGTSTANNSTITLISQNDYQVVLDVPEIDVAQLQVGQSADIRLNAYGDTVFPGKIISIDPAETMVSGVPVYETKVAFTTADARIRSGMTATATIVTATKNNVVVVPSNFVQTNSDGTSYVYLLDTDNKTKKQPVTTGLRGSDSTTEIVSGLAVGDRVSTVSL